MVQERVYKKIIASIIKMNDHFYTLWDYMNTKIVYISPKDLGFLNYHITTYIKKKPSIETLHVLYYSHAVYKNAEAESNNTYFHKCSDNYEPFFLLHILRYDSFYLKTPISEILEVYDRLHTPYSQFKTPPANSERAKYVEGQIENVYKKNLSRHYEATKRLESLTIDVGNTELYETLFNSIDTFISTNIPNIFNFRHFASMYWFPYTRQLSSSLQCKTIVLRDVFYKNKVWYDKERAPLKIAEFDVDFEYKLFPKKHDDITEDDTEEIETPMMFLDYVYDFYNFGEFWDVIKHLKMADPITQGLPLFHVPTNRVSDIEYYFSKLNYIYPSKTVYHRNKLYHFHEIYISIIEGATRGIFDRYFAYSLNSCMNPETTYTLPFSYKLYLTRGSYGRNMLNESSLIDELKDRYNFVVLNGSEPLNLIMYYFTHASLIIGAHSSLMKNMIWCSKNPIFIELTPLTRSLNPCFSANATSLGFHTMYFICNCDEKEQIQLSDTQRAALLELIGKLV